MATIKSHTDLPQSKKLAEFLPLESADMYWWSSGKRYYIESIDDDDYEEDKDIRAWSLAALLEEIPSTTVNNVGEDLKLHIDKYNLHYSLFYENEYTGHKFEIETDMHENLVDACVEMILKLHEHKIL